APHVECFNVITFFAEHRARCGMEFERGDGGLGDTKRGEFVEEPSEARTEFQSACAVDLDSRQFPKGPIELPSVRSITDGGIGEFVEFRVTGDKRPAEPEAAVAANHD